MKLKYEFTTITMDGKYCAVPVGDEGMNLHAVLQMNETTKDIMEILKEDVTEEQLVEKLTDIYDESREVIADAIKPTIAELKKAGVLSD